MAKTTKKSKPEATQKSSFSKEALMEYIQDITQRASQPEESRLHCAIAINQLLSNPSTQSLIDDAGKTMLKEVWFKLKGEGIQLEDPPFLFGLPENFDQEELAN